MKRVALLTSAIILMVSCAKEDVNTIVAGSSELNVKAGIQTILNTRTGEGVIEGNTFSENAEIAVLVTGADYASYQQGKFKLVSNAWDKIGDKVLLNTNFAKVYAYYPTDAVLSPTTPTNDDNNSILVNESSMNGNVSTFIRTNDTDYMYAETIYGYQQTGVNNRYNQVSLNFKHVLAKMTFIVKKDITYADVGVLSAIKFEDAENKFPSDPLKLNLKDGSFSAPTSTKETKLFQSSTPITIDANVAGNVTAQFLVFPRQKPLDSVEPTMLRLTMDGKDMEVALVTSEAGIASPQTTWLSGQNYVFNILVKPKGLIVESVTITPWLDVEVGDGEAI